MHKKLSAICPEAVITGLVFALGLTVTCGWLLHVVPMVIFMPGMLPLVFNTGAGFTLAAIAFWLSERSHRSAQKVCFIIGCFLVVFGGATLLEHLLDVNFGIDLAFVHRWYDYGNTRPGRMAPNTAIGFILIGSANILTTRLQTKWQAGTLIAFTFAILIIGLTGLIGYYAAPELLFGWARSARMALPTAVGMILCGIRFWLSWSKTEWYKSRQHFHEAEKIRYLAPAILLVITLTAGLLGFVFLQSSLSRILEANLESELRNRSQLFLLTIEKTERHSLASIRFTGLDEASREWLRAPPASDAEIRFNELTHRLIAEGFRGVALQNAVGTNLSAVGQLASAPPIEIPLSASKSSTLIWDNELVLRTHVQLSQSDHVLGTLIVEQSAATLNTELFNADKLGDTGEVALCIPRDSELTCFPGKRHDAPFVVPAYNKLGLPLPMKFAIEGQHGHITTLDYRGQNVIAAYGLLSSDLGIVVKQDTVELFGVIREALRVGAPFVLLLGLTGAALLYLQLKPLAAQMRASELSATEKELELRTVFDAVGDGILTIDERLQIRSINPAGCEIFGCSSTELHGQHLSAVASTNTKAVHIDELDRYLKKGLSDLVGRSNVEVIGCKKDGTEFPLELTINEILISENRLFVGILRDITERKYLQEKLSALALYDSLTGLPNRASFMEKLLGAAMRAERSRATLALMFLDLDGFKAVNDTLGHPAGDELLIQFARRLTATVRKVDVVARLAGDEFTILLDVTHPHDVESIAKKIIEAAQIPFVLGPKTAHVTVSIGIAIRESSTAALDIKKFIQEADAQMYVAKRHGKNQYSVKLV